MLRNSVLALSTAALLSTPAFAQEADIVDTAVAAGNFTTLVAAPSRRRGKKISPSPARIISASGSCRSHHP
jgi:hypothetical protein